VEEELDSKVKLNFTSFLSTKDMAVLAQFEMKIFLGAELLDPPFECA
jgi:hypothetical protein